MSKIIAINAGSSSLKFQLFDMPEETVLTKGLVERIGMDNSIFTISVDGEKKTEVTDIPDHAVAVKMLLEKLIEFNIIKDFNEIDGVGHRVVHGGEKFSDSVVLTDEVINDIDQLSELAPLHNPANVVGIKAFKQILPDVPAIAVFDTAFHQTMPEQSYLYSLPYDYYKNFGIRKYGFHGTSHKFVTERAAELLGRPLEELRLISCHLGNGASIAAVEGGKSIDTSMGFTPLAGVAMGTRSGNIDPALIPFIMEKTGHTAEEVLSTLNKKSGLLGVSGLSSDLRDIEEATEEGNDRAEVALDIFASRIHKYIGSYAARMNGVDAIIFTAGIGENSSEVRARVLRGLEFMGVYWDPSLNNMRGEEAFISYPHSPVKVIVIPTNEEVMIARDVMRLA
ncbi:acetate kinase [Bacillus altitudinis MN12]|jgi:acetate kinase|uniref:Acetate kinase n=2 Tax=Bacillus TaxID=1386 RepID=A0ABV1S5M1_BACAB|nr:MULTISPECIES: acetate kinase [Bacillus]AHL72431.1 acetate kinase [Bacillus pumilus]EMI12584.1 acetate kinase [Bacillus stratosphericus LAMA 585]KML04217.1 acetate kinase [Bacillus stratosphericus]MBW3700862.1 acetate kinase [Bacillus aerophilus]MDG3043174.1 acetate kinase [Bacillus sp. B6(2022)]MDH8711372.1 acetate kinase [Micromonospora sp. 1209]CVM36327.1 acetate kinase [Streptococcus pneumoniae]